MRQRKLRGRRRRPCSPETPYVTDRTGSTKASEPGHGCTSANAKQLTPLLFSATADPVTRAGFAKTEWPTGHDGQYERFIVVQLPRAECVDSVPTHTAHGTNARSFQSKVNGFAAKRNALLPASATDRHSTSFSKMKATRPNVAIVAKRILGLNLMVICVVPLAYGDALKT